MKDIVISGARIRRELWWLLAAFILANLMNIYAIASYGTEWKELLTMVGYVIALSVVLYFLLALIRWIVGLVRRLVRKRQPAS